MIDHICSWFHACLKNTCLTWMGWLWTQHHFHGCMTPGWMFGSHNSRIIPNRHPEGILDPELFSIIQDDIMWNKGPFQMVEWDCCVCDSGNVFREHQSAQSAALITATNTKYVSSGSEITLDSFYIDDTLFHLGFRLSSGSMSGVLLEDFSVMPLNTRQR